MTLQDANLLVVEDDLVLRTTLGLVLKQLGCRVHAAEDGLDALHVLEREHVDLILTDKHMPHMDGLMLIETLHERGTSIPSIFTLNGLESENLSRLAELGVVETITKPIHPVQLKALVERVVLALPAPACLRPVAST